MAWSLGLMGKSNLTGIDELTDDMYTQYKKHTEKIAEFQKDQQLHAIVNLNFDDIFLTMEKCMSDHVRRLENGGMNLDIIMLKINRCILNYLSSFRTYLDHTEALLKRKYGKDADQVKKFNSACSNEYDSHFSYRFLYKLRNYSQHCGMPVGNFTIVDKEDKANGGNVREFKVQFNRDSLLSNYDSWSLLVESEIIQLPPYFVVNPYFEELQQSINRIHLVLIEIRLPELTESVGFLEEMIEPLKGQPGIPCIINFDNMHPEGGKVRIEHLPLHLLESVSKLTS